MQSVYCQTLDKLMYNIYNLKRKNLWLMPYISCTTIFFYLDLQPQIETISPQTAWNPYVEGYEEPRQGEIVDFYPDRDNK